VSYDKKFRESVLKHVSEGHSKESTRKLFGLGKNTIADWEKLQAETGSLEKRKLDRKASIFKSAELNDYNEKNPNALLKDIAQHFGITTDGAYYKEKRMYELLYKNEALKNWFEKS